MKNKLIEKIVKMSFDSGEGHIPSALSILDLLIVLYGRVIDKDNQLILSKGHASLSLYVVLDHYNLLGEDLETFCKFNSNIGGHPSNKLENIVCSTGSLGHGFPIAVGLALSKKIKKEPGKVYCIIGDGECNEGTVWESALLSTNLKLDNLVCIVDYNRSNDRSLKLDSLIDKFKSFNWNCHEINGHNQSDIINSLNISTEEPLCIIANTIKGCGISFMENNHEWHHKTPTLEEYNLILDELKIE